MYFSFLLLFLFFFWKYNKSRYVYIISSQSQDLVVFGSHCCLWTSIFFSEATEQSEPKHNRNLHLIDGPLLCLWFCDNLKFNMAVKTKNACWLVKIFQKSSCHDQQPHILWYCCNMCIILGWYSTKFMLFVLIQINFCVRVILLWKFI